MSNRPKHIQDTLEITRKLFYNLFHNSSMITELEEYISKLEQSGSYEDDMK